MMFMATIKNVGAPTKRTKGGIGDIYIDKATGRKYKCVGSYGSAAHEAEYYWRALKDKEPVVENTVEPEQEVQPEAPASENSDDQESVQPEAEQETPASENGDDQDQDPVQPDAEPENDSETKKPKDNRRTNYSAAYNKNK